MRIIQAAVGDIGLPVSTQDVIGFPLTEILSDLGLGSEWTGALQEGRPAHVAVLRLEGGELQVIAHRSGDVILVEFEAPSLDDPKTFDSVYPHVRDFLDSLQGAGTIEDLSALAAREVRRITGLDRVLVYRFDDDWNGAVIAEDRNDVLPSYLDLRFPASDIPAQARELYRVNRLRLIANVDYTPIPIVPALNPKTGGPIDLTFSVLRSVSPVHLEYMRNMGTMASMSISLMRDARLWGLISCHSRDPARVSYHVRTACDFIGQMLSIQLAAREASDLSDRRNALRSYQTRLLTRMASAPHFSDGLVAGASDLLALTGASGAAIVVGGSCRLVGETPAESSIRQMVDHLAAQGRGEMFVTDCLAAHLPNGERLKDLASGVLAISISQIHDSYVLWFRPEVIRTISWGGDPRKAMSIGPAGGRLHPRTSFEAWRQSVELHARPWEPAEIEAASELRSAIVDIVLRQAEEMAAVSERLASINKELEAFSYSVSHDLRAPFRHIVGYAQLLRRFEGERLTERGNRVVDTIIESAISAGTLVDELLHFSQMGRATLTPVAIDMNVLLEEVRTGLVVEGGGKDSVEWHIAPLPPARADPIMMRLVFQNLIENALKFSRHRQPAVIEIGGSSIDAENVYFVKDNGAGFDMAYVGKLFGVFQRLHRVEEFEGTGIGLANVKRIVERHGGRIWAEGVVDGGATFTFTLPAPKSEAIAGSSDGKE